MGITYLTLKSAKTFRDGALGAASPAPATFVSCLRGKISLYGMLTFNYPLLCRGDLRLSMRSWAGVGVGSGVSVPTTPIFQPAGAQQRPADPCPVRTALLRMPQTLYSHYNKS